MDKKSPLGWGDDSLSAFIETVKNNIYATFANHRAVFNRIQKIDEAFRFAVDHLYNTKEWFPSFFLLRAHSAYLGAARLSLSFQVGEAYMVLRGCLENALYGFFFYKNPKKAHLWYERHDSIIKRKEVRREFQIKRMIEALKEENNQVAQVATILYERCIDYGAHPNERSISSVLEKSEEGRNIYFTIYYLPGDTLPAKACLKTTAQVGVCCLRVFELIFKTRFELMGLSDRVKELQKGL